MSEIPYDWAKVPCPSCAAGAQQRCRAKSGRTTDAHAKRVEAAGYRAGYERHGCHCATPGLTGFVSSYGMSAYAIKHGGTDHPYDPSDLCRCLHVSPGPPVHMRGRTPKWTVLVDHWDELAELLREEHPTGRAPRTYARMNELFELARRAA